MGLGLVVEGLGFGGLRIRVWGSCFGFQVRI